MNNNGDDHGNYESGDDGERGVLAWWASDATLARHPPLPSGQMVHMGQPTSVTSVGAKNPKNPHLSSLQCIGSNVYSFVLPCENSVQTICSADVSVRIVYETSYPPRRRSLQSLVRLSGTD